MERVAGFLDKRFIRFDPSNYEFKDFDIITWGRRTRFYGMVLDRELLLLDWKKLASCRIRLANLARIARNAQVQSLSPERNPPFAPDYLRGYLRDNEDNPFGLWNAFRSVGDTPIPKALTQFPPLSYPKTRQRLALDEMREQAQSGDAIFTFDRASGLSSMIRDFDWCMWSHVANYVGDGLLSEATTQGVVESSFDRLYEKSLDSALYRVPEITDEQREKMVAYLRRPRAPGGRYAWGTVVRIALNKNLGIPYKRKPNELAPADLMYANKFELVCYA
jgi:hypothetical protein